MIHFSEPVLAGLFVAVAFFAMVGIPLIRAAYRGDHRRNARRP